MKTVVVGAGAMGTFIAARLCRAGHEVWLLEINENRVKQIKQQGITLDEKGCLWHSEFTAITPDATQIGEADVVVFMVKAFDTESAVKLVLPAITEKTLVLTLQNGIGNIEIISKYISKNQLFAGTTAHGALFVGEGRVKHAGQGDTTIGALTVNSQAGVKEIKRLFDSSGIYMDILNDVNSLLWGKLIVNMSINPLTAIFRIRNGRIFDMPHLIQVVKDLIDEGMKVVSVMGVTLPYADPFKKVKEVCMKTSDNQSSMFQDIIANRKTEIKQINGAVADYGNNLGIPTPVNRILTELILSIEQIKP